MTPKDFTDCVTDRLCRRGARFREEDLEAFMTVAWLPERRRADPEAWAERFLAELSRRGRVQAARARWAAIRRGAWAAGCAVAAQPPTVVWAYSFRHWPAPTLGVSAAALIVAALIVTRLPTTRTGTWAGRHDAGRGSGEGRPGSGQAGCEVKADMPDGDQGIKRRADGVRPQVDGATPAPAGTPPAEPVPSWEDNPYRRRGLGWEGSFADTGLVPIVALACLVGPVALALGLLGGLFLRGPRARRKAWIMAAAAAPVTAVWAMVIALRMNG